MKAQRRWLVASPHKVPYYVNGSKRNGTLDAPDDVAQLASYEDAQAALSSHPGWLLGFALGADGNGGHWQGIDLDHVMQNGLADLANNAPGYSEVSPSGEGAHAIGYGLRFDTLGSNGSGIEAYAGGRYFTVTENRIRDGGLVCLASFVAQTLRPRHGAGKAAANVSSVELISLDASTKRDIRSALASMRSDDRALWIRIGHALRELGDIGRALWFEWSQTSEKYDPIDAARAWNSFKPTATSYQAVFAEAQRHGWLNPGTKEAQPATVPSIPDGQALLEQFGIDWTGQDDADVPDIVEGLVADEEVTLLGGHGGVGKGFLALQMACAVALGEPVLNSATRQSRVLYYSAEDGRKRMTRRLRRVAEMFDYDAVRLRQNLCVLDASEVEPLYGEKVEHSPDGRRFAKILGSSSDFDNLRSMVATFDPQLVIIDGASDTFDGNEIARREVRAFIKMLRRVHPNRSVGVLLIVHIDRSSARGYTTNDDGYAGSAQWHNSCRRRVFIQHQIKKERGDDGEDTILDEKYVLRVMKNQDGPPAADLELQRGEWGLWQLGVEIGAEFKRDDISDVATLLFQLIGDYYSRGKYISTSFAPQATTGVYDTLKGDPAFPRGLSKKRTSDVVRSLERDGALVVEPYQRKNRSWAERWAIGRDPSKPFEQVAQTAPSCTE
jgi:hypothetical protein